MGTESAEVGPSRLQAERSSFDRKNRNADFSNCNNNGSLHPVDISYILLFHPFWLPVKISPKFWQKQLKKYDIKSNQTKLRSMPNHEDSLFRSSLNCYA
ncbi:hypothetical protein AVEN_211027-1 [Araneus ventricosus]|uniref:Uncharacterized protein n=1 Tax=Araneus ventricosus TaxID=182803 RepID=A0A4Y2TYF1_ARAVE|nr:hypothetical protein AVEN_211027-1 [Araneus ventricosus]